MAERNNERSNMANIRSWETAEEYYERQENEFPIETRKMKKCLKKIKDKMIEIKTN